MNSTQNGRTIWFTADLHFGHGNVIGYANRPFRDADEMDEAMIVNWNERVRPGDEVYVVGDFSFHKPARTVEILTRLQGQKFLVRGNHDKSLREHELSPRHFRWIRDVYTVKVDDPDALGGTQRIVLFHYAMRVWDQSHRGAWHLYGHSHGSLPDDQRTKSFDIGVDCHGFRPLSYADVKALMRDHAAESVDHHTRERA